jgi:Ca2+-binding RTX toxin-like protein
MFAKRPGLKILCLGLLTTGVLACQQQQQQKEAAGPINFDPSGFEGLETTQFALLSNNCDPDSSTASVVVAQNEFAYLYRRPDGQVVVNATTSTGSQCMFADTKPVAITAAETEGSANHKVLIDFLNNQFAAGSDSEDGITNIGITIDLGTTGTNQVMFRGTMNPDIFTLGTKSGTSYLAFSSASSDPTANAYADISMVNVSDITVSTGPGDDVITGQGGLSHAALDALDQDISLTAFGGDGDDQITSGAGGGAAVNSLNGNAGADIFAQVADSGNHYANDVIAGGTDAVATVTRTNSSTSTGTTTDTSTSTSTATGTSTSTSTGTGTGTTNRTATGTQTGTGTSTRTRTTTLTRVNTGTITVTNTNTDTNTDTNTVTNTDTGTHTATQSDTSIDVVDYSARSSAVQVTIGDESDTAYASSTVVCPSSDGIRSYDAFSITDGDLSSPITKVVEFHKTGDHMVGDITVPAGGATDLATDETFTIDDGSAVVTFHLEVGTATSTNTNTSVVIHIADDAVQTAVATAIAAGIHTYQVGTWTGVDNGTGTMTSTSISPNVTVQTADGVVSVQNRSSVSHAMLAASAENLTAVDDESPAPLWNANATAIVVTIADSSSDASTVATDVAAAIVAHAGDSPALAVTASASGTIVTVTTTEGHVNLPGFAVTKKSAAFDISSVSLGTAATGAGRNDGDLVHGESDSVLADIEMVVGGSGNDTIDATHATLSPHTLLGMAGNDILRVGPGTNEQAASISHVLYGGTGNDQLLGGRGVDNLYGGSGDDYLAGGPGDDVINGEGANCPASGYVPTPCSGFPSNPSGGSNFLDFSDRSAAVTVDLSTLGGQSPVTGEEGEHDTVTNCANLRGGSGADVLTGSSGDNIIYGGPGDDSIYGGDGNDVLYGDTGDDHLEGEVGDDFLYGGSGVNTIWGDSSTNASVVGNNMLDNSQGVKGDVRCGDGNMDILFSDGEETHTDTCELK